MLSPICDILEKAAGILFRFRLGLPAPQKVYTAHPDQHGILDKWMTSKRSMRVCVYKSVFCVWGFLCFLVSCMWRMDRIYIYKSRDRHTRKPSLVSTITASPHRPSLKTHTPRERQYKRNDISIFGPCSFLFRPQHAYLSIYTHPQDPKLCVCHPGARTSTHSRPTFIHTCHIHGLETRT